MRLEDFSPYGGRRRGWVLRLCVDCREAACTAWAYVCFASMIGLVAILIQELPR